MQGTKRIKNSGNTQGTILKAVSIFLLGLSLQACQTTGSYQANPNLGAFFAGSAQLFSSTPTYGPATPYRPPAQANPFVQNQPQAQQEAPLFGEGSLFNQ